MDSGEVSKSHWPRITMVVAGLLCLYWGALFYATHMPLPPGVLPGNSDKFVHFAAYAGLAVLLLSLRATRGAFPWYSVFARWCFLALYGVFDEATQYFVKRSPDIDDWIADVLGVTFGLALVTFFVWIMPRFVGMTPKTANEPEISPP